MDHRQCCILVLTCSASSQETHSIYCQTHMHSPEEALQHTSRPRLSRRSCQKLHASIIFGIGKTYLTGRRVWYNSFDLGTRKFKDSKLRTVGAPLRAPVIGVSKTMQFLAVRRIPLTLLGFIVLAVSVMHAQITVCGAEGQDSANTSCCSASDLVDERPANGVGRQIPRHVVCLSWKASTSRHVIGYNVYRRVNFGIRRKLNQRPIRRTHYTDRFVYPGYTYHYHVRAVDSRGRESAPSNHAIVYIPR